MGFLRLGIDSVIACLAVGGLIDKESRVKYAVLFDVADAVPAMRRAATTRVAGIALLIAAGALFVVG